PDERDEGKQELHKVDQRGKRYHEPSGHAADTSRAHCFGATAGASVALKFTAVDCIRAACSAAPAATSAVPGPPSLAAARSCFAFLMARICEGSEVMIWSSVYEAMILIATCLSPAKNIPSPTSDS